MPQSIPAGITRDHVLRALADLDGDFSHPYGQPTGYELLHEGRRYAPKAVIGVAYRHLAGQVLQPKEFSGGEAPGQANFVLRRLGFAVVKKGEDGGGEQDQVGREWSENEVGVIVADYFDMLRAELHGRISAKRSIVRRSVHSCRHDPKAPSSSSIKTSALCWSSWVCLTSMVTSRAGTTRVCWPTPSSRS